jgi:protein-disulfide isomerase
MVRSSSQGRLTARDLGEAVPARLVAVCDELDLAIVEAMPTEVVFYPHLPIARSAVAAGSVALAVGHTRKLGLWSAAMVPVGPPSGSAGGERWLRTLPSEPSPLSPGTPLLDAIGRVVGVVTNPIPNSSRMAIDPEGLLRFVLAARAPELRFAGVPSFRRPTSVEVAAMGLHRGISKREDPSTSSPGGLPPGGSTTRMSSAPPVAWPTGLTPEALPGIAKKGAIDRHFTTSSVMEPHKGSGSGATAGDEPTAASSAWRASALAVTLASLEQQGVPESLQVDTSDAPQRGERNAAVTIVELGDYHAPETRDADATVRALVEGPNAPARLLWKDADRGDGPDYWLPARAARAAAEQGQFWAMHDQLMRVASQSVIDRVHEAARDLGLDEGDFSASLSSEGIASAIETEAARAARLPLLCTPSFVVNGRAVDGGSIAALALKAAVDEELWRVPGQSPIAVRSPRGIAGGSPIAGAAFDPDKMARVIADASARRAAHPAAAHAGPGSGQ